MRVLVDRDLCEGNGVCEALCPEVFQVTSDDVVNVKKEALTPEHHQAVRKAVSRCPKAALQVQE